MPNKSHKTQIEKYGGIEGYKAEMKRRRALVKSAGFSNMDKEKHKQISVLGGKARWKNAKNKDTTSGQSI